jgi:anti-sigma regulatory factor (Ser/Thr protein kinase)
MPELVVKALIDNYEMCAAFIEEQLEKKALVNRETKIKVITACEEIIVNIMNYAYPDQEGELVIIYDDEFDPIKITFVDNGKPFNPLDEPEADFSLSLEERGIGGLGILLVKKLMDDVHYQYKDNQNILTIVKKLSL